MKCTIVQFVMAGLLGWGVVGAAGGGFGVKEAKAAPAVGPGGSLGGGEFCYNLTKRFTTCCGRKTATFEINSSGFDCSTPGFTFVTCFSGFCREEIFTEYCSRVCGDQ